MASLGAPGDAEQALCQKACHQAASDHLSISDRIRYNTITVGSRVRVRARARVRVRVRVRARVRVTERARARVRARVRGTVRAASWFRIGGTFNV